MATLGQAYVQIVPSAQGIKGAISSQLGGEASAAGETAGKTLASKIKGALVAAGIGAAVGKLIKDAVAEGGKLQQSYGGLDTIYGKASGAAKEYAEQAYKAGISANDYAEQAVSFGASLKQAFGGDTTKAVEAANTAIMDMTDNAAKMGTPIENIQNAYQGFAKQNYTMLDNLKLGYGGTKQEMQRLLDDAEKFSGVKYDINNLGDVYDAIHVIQGELGLTGVAAAEASETFEGSFNAMKAAGQNFLGALALGEDVTGPLTQLMQTVSTFLFNNLLPMVGNILKALPQVAYTAITTGLPMFMSAGAEMLKGIASGITTGLPMFMSAGAEMLKGIASGITANLPTVAANGRQMLVGMANSFLANLPTFIGKVGDLINAIVAFIDANLPTIMAEGIALVKQLAAGLVANLPAILAAMAKLAGTILSAIVKLAPKLMTAGAAAIMSLAKGLGGAALGAVKSAMSKVLSAITAPINKAKSVVSGFVSKVKGMFPLNLGKVFNLKLPHFTITSAGKFPWGIGGKGSLPKWEVNWNAKGAIFDEPTILQGVGEAGPEAVIPLDRFWRQMDAIAENSKGNEITINVYGAEGQNPKALAEEVKRVLIRETKQRRLAW